MTKQQVARELVEKFEGLLFSSLPIGDESFSLEAKQCAIIACNEILKALKTTTGHLTLNRTDLYGVKSDEQYWENIIQEIQKL